MTLISRKEFYIRTLSRGFLAILLLGVVTFVGFQVYPLLHGPSLHLETLSQGMHVQEPLIRIAGIARHTQDLVLNGKHLPLSPTDIVSGREQRLHKLPPSPERAMLRSKTFQGIADAMAEQWGGHINKLSTE